MSEHNTDDHIPTEFDKAWADFKVAVNETFIEPGTRLIERACDKIVVLLDKVRRK